MEAACRDSAFDLPASSQPTTAQDFGGVTARTLVLRGSRTRLVTKKIANVLCQAFPHWQLQKIQDAGHVEPLPTVRPSAPGFHVQSHDVG